MWDFQLRQECINVCLTIEFEYFCIVFSKKINLVILRFQYYVFKIKMEITIFLCVESKFAVSQRQRFVFRFY